MINYEKHMFIALALSVLVMVVNIVAVTTGMADGYYSQITDWLNSL